MRPKWLRVVPSSLFGRLLASAGLFIIIALVVAGLSIGQVLERFVMRGLDVRLDAQITLLARAVRPDGTLDTRFVVDVPPYDRAGSGWAWQITAPMKVLRSGSLGDRAMPEPLMQPRSERRHRDNRKRPADGISRTGEAIHFRVLTLDTAKGPVTITAAGPREIAERPLRQALAPLLSSLAILGLVLIAAIFLQLQFGLRPLRGLQASLVAIRQGRAHHVPSEQPVELRGVVGELNALIDQNEAGLENARRHVANLAHGLKTPLAALQVKLAESGHDPDGELRALTARMDASIRHHLARARAAAPGRPERQATPLMPHLTDLTGTLARIHADRTLDVTMTDAPDMAVACDPQDLDEMLGNLLDNAWRWARSAIDIAATSDGNAIAVTIADDGPGLSSEAREAALIAGRRLDERGDGHGFGLSITRELAELYGGSLTLETADTGGLAVILSLPRAAA